MADRAWNRAPDGLRRAAKRAWFGYARMTSEGRMLPDYLIIGAQRAGTSSVYEYLIRHPAIARALTKEVRYFDLQYERGPSWYRSHFPSTRHRDAIRRRAGLRLITGEASPDYLAHPLVPQRVRALVPSVKLIVLLRNPVDRAYSHYWHQVHRGFEDLSFEEAIAREPQRIRGELDRIAGDPRYSSFEYHHHSYLARGRYVEQLRWWFHAFPRDRFAVVRSEDLFADPPGQIGKLLEFLDVPQRPLGRFPRSNTFTSNRMADATRAELVEHFAPCNAELAGLLSWQDRPWDA